MKWTLLLLPVAAAACATSAGAIDDPGHADQVDGAPPADAEICARVKVDITKQIPTVMLLVDRSYSMTTTFGNTSRWAAIYNTLMDPSVGVVPGLQGSVRFGLDMFTSPTSSGQSCPYMTYVPPALDNYNSIKTVYQPAQPLMNTPTGPAISAAASAIASVSAPGPKFIVLATDGLPNNCDASSDGRAAAIAAAQAAYAQGIKMFIVGVSADIAGSHLQDMANAGSGLPVGGTRNAPYWQAFNPQGVVDAMNAIIGGGALLLVHARRAHLVGRGRAGERRPRRPEPDLRAGLDGGRGRPDARAPGRRVHHAQGGLGARPGRRVPLPDHHPVTGPDRRTARSRQRSARSRQRAGTGVGSGPAALLASAGAVAVTLALGRRTRAAGTTGTWPPARRRS
jgi:hypothetical protein